MKIEWPKNADGLYITEQVAQAMEERAEKEKQDITERLGKPDEVAFRLYLRGEMFITEHTIRRLFATENYVDHARRFFMICKWRRYGACGTPPVIQTLERAMDYD